MAEPIQLLQHRNMYTSTHDCCFLHLLSPVINFLYILDSLVCVALQFVIFHAPIHAPPKEKSPSFAHTNSNNNTHTKQQMYTLSRGMCAIAVADGGFSLFLFTSLCALDFDDEVCNHYYDTHTRSAPMYLFLVSFLFFPPSFFLSPLSRLCSSFVATAHQIWEGKKNKERV